MHSDEAPKKKQIKQLSYTLTFLSSSRPLAAASLINRKAPALRPAVPIPFCRAFNAPTSSTNSASTRRPLCRYSFTKPLRVYVRFQSEYFGNMHLSVNHIWVYLHGIPRQLAQPTQQPPNTYGYTVEFHPVFLSKYQLLQPPLLHTVSFKSRWMAVVYSSSASCFTSTVSTSPRSTGPMNLRA